MFLMSSINICWYCWLWKKLPFVGFVWCASLYTNNCYSYIIIGPCLSSVVFMIGVWRNVIGSWLLDVVFVVGDWTVFRSSQACVKLPTRSSVYCFPAVNLSLLRQSNFIVLHRWGHFFCILWLRLRRLGCPFVGSCVWFISNRPEELESSRRTEMPSPTTIIMNGAGAGNGIPPVNRKTSPISRTHNQSSSRMFYMHPPDLSSTKLDPLLKLRFQVIQLEINHKIRIS
jgi:hypothetical protein